MASTSRISDKGSASACVKLSNPTQVAAFRERLHHDPDYATYLESPSLEVAVVVVGCVRRADVGGNIDTRSKSTYLEDRELRICAHADAKNTYGSVSSTA